MPGLYSRVKNWIARETLKKSDLNAEFDNIITNFVPAMMDDYSTNVTQMQIQTDPGAVGTESLATSLAGELERIRYVIKRIMGETYWYTSPDSSIASLKSTLDSATLLPRNRIVSGRVDANNQPMFLVPNGGLSVKLDGTPTTFTCFIDDTQVDVTSDLTLSGLSGPASYTQQINGAQSNLVGENNSLIVIDTAAGSAPAVNSYQSWKVVNGGSTEYFYARFDSATALSNARRGFFFDASDNPIPNISLGDNNVVTLMRTGYIFLSNVGGVKALEVTYNKPTVSKDTPTGSSVGDFWFDTDAAIWKKSDGSNFTNATAIFVGLAVIDGASVVATRSADFNKVFNDLNTFNDWDVLSNTVIRSQNDIQRVSVYGESFEFFNQDVDFDITLDLDSGLVEAGDTDYYAYITDAGDTILSSVVPYDRSYDLLGFYHRYKPWRAVACARNNVSSNFSKVFPVMKLPAVPAIVPTAVTASTSSGTFQDAGNDTVIYARYDTPVCIMTAAVDGSTTYVTVASVSTINTVTAEIRVIRGSTTVGTYNMELVATNAAGTLSLRVPGGLIWVDRNPPTGYQTYQLQMRVTSAATTTVTLTGISLVAFHLKV